MNKLIGLILQITSIYCIGNSFFLQIFLGEKWAGVLFLSLGIVLWAVGYFFLHDLEEIKK